MNIQEDRIIQFNYSLHIHNIIFIIHEAQIICNQLCVVFDLTVQHHVISICGFLCKNLEETKKNNVNCI
jgi:hypothetical protein